MASYTTSLRLVQPATGEYSGTWGTQVNTGLTALVDTSIAGTATITMTTADYTLSTANGATDEARAMVLNLTGTPGAARNVICPAVSKVYIVYNNTTGGFAQTLKTSAGTGISVPNGATAFLRCDGTNVVAATNYLGSLTLGSPLVATSGGTGQSSYAVGDLLFASTTTALSKLADVATGNALISGGVGVAPSYGKIGLTTHVSGTLPVANGGTGSTSTTYCSLTSNVTGTLPVGNGGTGATSLTANNVILGNGTSAVQFVAPGASGNILLSNGTTWTSAANPAALTGTTQSSIPRLTALGSGAGTSVSTGNSNTFVGYDAGNKVTTASNNSAFGSGALSNSTSAANDAFGVNTLNTNTTGTANAAFGRQALQLSNGDNNTAVGVGAGNALTTGSNNIIIGYNAAASSATVSNEITLGNSSITNLRVPGVGFSFDTTDGLIVPKTVTATGTTGAQTINKTAGTVNFAAAATSLVVTNSFVDANSIIIATVGTDDTTMKSVAAVAAAGSFTLYANAAATAETRVNFMIIN